MDDYPQDDNTIIFDDASKRVRRVLSVSQKVG